MTTTATNIEQKELPAGWKWVKLGDVASLITKGTTPTTLGYKYATQGIPFLRLLDVKGGPINVEGVEAFIDEEVHGVLNRSHVYPNDLLITISGTLGRVGFVPSKSPVMNINQNVAIIRLNESQLSIEFAYFACTLQSQQLVQGKAGSTMSTLSLTQIGKLPIPLPPLGEQKRIAGILNEQMAAVEEAKKAAQERLEAVKALPAAYLRDALEGPESKDWGTVPLGNLFHLKHGYTFKGEYFSDHGIYQVLTPGHFLANGGLNEKRDSPIYYSGDFPDEFLLQTNDLLVVMTDLKWDAPILGSAGFIPEDNRFLHNQRLGKLINWDKSLLHLKFVYHLFNAEYVRRQIKASATGSTVRHTSPKRIYEVKVYFPSVQVQKRIASELDDKIAGVKLAEAPIQQELDTIEAMPAAFLRQAFSGAL